MPSRRPRFSPKDTTSAPAARATAAGPAGGAVGGAVVDDEQVGAGERLVRLAEHRRQRALLVPGGDEHERAGRVGGHAPTICPAGGERRGRAHHAGHRARAARSPSWQYRAMQHVLGIGGHFMRATDPTALGAWYRDCLGLDADEMGLWRQQAGPTVFATFESETDYFGPRSQQSLRDFRVRDLDAMLSQLRAKGADVAEDASVTEGSRRAS